MIYGTQKGGTKREKKDRKIIGGEGKRKEKYVSSS